MPNNPFGRKDSTHPCFGIQPAYFTVGDLPRNDVSPLTALNAVSTDTTSAAQSTNSANIELALTTSVANATCTLIVYKVDGGDVEIKRFVAVKAGTRMFVGGFEGVNLEGRQVKVRAESISSGNVTVKIKRY